LNDGSLTTTSASQARRLMEKNNLPTCGGDVTK
jgi:hypothetical protein